MGREGVIIVIAALLPGLGRSPMSMAAAPDASVISIRAELIKGVEARNLKEGDVFYLRTMSAWQQGGCTLREHTTIMAEVAGVKRRGGGQHSAELSLRFGPVPCSAAGEGREVTPLLIAMLGAPTPPSEGLRRLETAQLEGMALQSMFNPNPPSNIKVNDPLSTSANAIPSFNPSELAARTEQPIKTGEVIGMRGVRMELPGTTAVTTLTSSRDVSLDRGTEFVFAFVAFSSGSARPPEVAHGGSSTRRAEAKAADVPRTDLIASKPEPAAPQEVPEVCAAGGCKELAALPTAGKAMGAEWMLSPKRLGFEPRLKRLITGPDDEASVHFLGEDEVLFTFGVHALVRRSAEQMDRGVKPRQVRAVVISRSGGEVLLVRDWTVPEESGPYVWSLGGGRVLVHEGGELVTYGPGLVEEDRFELPGPLLFASVAPGGTPLLAATVHERHGREEHGRLAAFLGPDQPIDEDYELTALTGTLEVTGRRVLGVEPLQPALLSGGMVSVRNERGSTWRLMEEAWGGKGKELVGLSSFCDVSVRSLPGNLLFARGCASGSFERTWYRLMNAEGATLLKGALSGEDYLQQAESDGAGDVLALASSHFDEPLFRKLNLRVEDFREMTVAVYRTATGQAILTVHPATGSAVRDTVALSPSGRSLAVLSNDAISVYAVEGGAGASAVTR